MTDKPKHTPGPRLAAVRKLVEQYQWDSSKSFEEATALAIEIDALYKRGHAQAPAGYELAQLVLTCDAYLGGDVPALRLLLEKARSIVRAVEEG